MLFKIQAERHANDIRYFTYDNETNILTRDDGFVYALDDKKDYSNRKPFTPFSKDTPLKKSKDVTRVKIQMGLSCNYSCDYCSQKFVERPPETSKKDIDAFLEKLEVFNFSEQRGLNFEFWGGEPLVYWKTLKPLAEAIQDKFSHWKNPPKFSIITNGSILTKEICAWLMYMGFSVSISHDGPGQYVRGPDPFDDPEQKRTILQFYSKMRPLGRISFNSILTKKNQSRKKIHEWFLELTGDPNVGLGEGGIVDSYDEDGIDNSLNTKQEHFEFRRTSFNDIYSNNGNIGFGNVLTKIDGFIESVLNNSPSSILNQKCGMDSPSVIAIDMKGNVLTCQNVSALEISKNGQPHLAGNIDNFDDIKVTTSTHWSLRDNCKDCPVLHLCKGSCMFLDNKYWDISCNNAYSDNIALFALAFEKITEGYIPTFIDSENLPDDRKDIWGTVLEHVEVAPKKKTFPIKVVTEKVVLDETEVYTKAKLLQEKL